MNKKLGNIFKGDKVIWMIFFFLCMISITEVYSASSSLSYKGGAYWGPVLRHSGFLALGTALMVVILNVKCKYFKLATPILLTFSFITLIWVLLAGQSTNGANRWMSIIGFQFQPSEIAKGTLVLAVAQILSAMQTDRGVDRKAIKYILVVCAFLVIPIMLENLSTAMLICVTVVLMMFIGRVPLDQIGKLIGVVTICIAIMIGVIMLIGSNEKQDTASQQQVLTEISVPEKSESTGGFEKIFHRASTWKARILKFFDRKYVAPEDYDLDKDAQVAHANIAITTSNIVGKGPGNSTERDFLSQAFSDFIYAIIIEEMGIVGATGVALLYIFLLFRTGRIANRCENAFPAFLAMGIALLLVVQALFNMLVAVGLAPVTGQPLPLISRGGTSTIINCIYIGVILSISRSAKRKDSKMKVDTVLAPVPADV